LSSSCESTNGQASAMSDPDRADGCRGRPGAVRLRLQTRWLVFRARFSTPALLASHDEEKVTSTLTALNGGAVILVLGTFAWLTELPLIFPALGPTAFILFSAPLSATAIPRTVVLGHWTALGAGFATWHSTAWLANQSVSATTGGWPVVIPCRARPAREVCSA